MSLPISEGSTADIIRTSNDQMGGGLTIGENVLNNEQEHLEMASALGFKEVFDFSHRHLRMNGISSADFRGRLILIFRMLTVDTVITLRREDSRTHSAGAAWCGWRGGTPPPSSAALRNCRTAGHPAN